MINLLSPPMLLCDKLLLFYRFAFWLYFHFFGGYDQDVDTFEMRYFYNFLPLDEAIASRAVVVIVSGSDGRTGGRKHFWNQLNNSKTVRYRPDVSMGS